MVTSVELGIRYANYCIVSCTCQMHNITSEAHDVYANHVIVPACNAFRAQQLYICLLSTSLLKICREF